MRYYKVVENGTILTIGKGLIQIGTEITENEYNSIMAVIQSCPRREGYTYRLKTDLTWEEHEKEPLPEEDPDSEEALSILLGGEA